MPRKRDPNFTTGVLCRFCGQLVQWGTILRLIRVDPDTPPFMLQESLTDYGDSALISPPPASKRPRLGAVAAAGHRAPAAAA